MNEATFRCGFVAIVGRPNVGKSTLINAILGNKVSIVTPKPQTTRHRILGVDSHPSYQAIYVDTPGIHRNSSKAMNRLMNRTATSALNDADLVLFMTVAGRWTNEDEDVLQRLTSIPVPVLALLNKIDEVYPKENLLQALAEMAERRDFSEIIPMSALKNDNIQSLLKLVPAFLPISEPLFPMDAVTDRSEQFHAAETIREKLTLSLRQEIPYGLTVQIERFQRDKRGVEIHAIVWVERDSQKGIVVGKDGSMLKRVGRSARTELKEKMGVPVHLEIWVKVKQNWADNEQELHRLGYEST